MMPEWRSVPGFDLYEVSNYGQVRRVKSGRILKPLAGKTGHLSVSLRRNPYRWQASVHVLVLRAFVGPRPEGMEARHYPDRDPANNRLDNLSWDTRLVNVRDRAAHGTDNSGERHGMSVLDWAAVRAIRATGRERTQRQLAKEFGVHYTTIGAVLRGRNWRET